VFFVTKVQPSCKILLPLVYFVLLLLVFVVAKEKIQRFSLPEKPLSLRKIGFE